MYQIASTPARPSQRGEATVELLSARLRSRLAFASDLGSLVLQDCVLCQKFSSAREVSKRSPTSHCNARQIERSVEKRIALA